MIFWLSGDKIILIQSKTSDKEHSLSIICLSITVFLIVSDSPADNLVFINAGDTVLTVMLAGDSSLAIDLEKASTPPLDAI